MANEAKITLSAEGVQQVVNAFKKVRDEANRAGNEGAKGIGTLNKALGGLKTIAAAVGIGALVVHLKEKAKAAIEAADAVGDLAAITGATTETISLFAFAARESGSSTEVLQKGIVHIAQALDALKSGDRAATELFRRIGLSAKDFVGLSFDESLKKVALRLGSLGGDERTVTVATQLLGKKSIELIEVFGKMADEGIGPLSDRAKKLGVIFSQDMTDAADKAKTALNDMQAKSEAATAQFLFGLAPGVSKAVDAIEQGFGERGTSGFKKFGETVGWLVQKLTQLFNVLTAIIGGFVGTEWKRFETSIEVLSKLASGDFGGAKQALKQGLSDARSIAAESVANTSKAFRQLTGAEVEAPAAAPPAKAPPDKNKALGARNLGDISKAEKARADLLKSQLDNELKLFTAHLALRSDAEKRDFENGLSSLAQYFAQRRAALQAESEKELSALTRRRAIVAATPNREAGDAEKKAKELGEIDLQIAEKRIDAQRKLADVIQEERVSVRDMARERVQFDSELLTLQGKRFDAARKNFEEEVKQADLMLRKQGVGDSERAGIIGRFETQGKAGIDFDEQREKAENALRELERGIVDIQRQIATGQMGQLQGEQQIVLLQQQRLPLLDAEAAKLAQIAIATGNAQNVEQANQFKDAIAEVGVAANKTGRDLAEVRAGIETGGLSAGAELFNDIITGAKSGAEAVNGFAKSVLASFASIISKKLSEKLFGSLFGSLGELGGSTFKLFSGSKADGGKITGFNEGGKIVGPGTGTSDSIPAIGPMGRLLRVSNDEFIVRAAIVRQPGAEAFLHQFNQGMHMRSIRSFARAPRFAGGGVVGGGTSAGLNAPVPPPMQVVISPDMAHMTLRDWLEGHLARELANR